jgi:hypothetical protein
MLGDRRSPIAAGGQMKDSVHSVHSVQKQKAMRGKRMAEMELLAPYGGITRIRFKGSPTLF